MSQAPVWDHTVIQLKRGIRKSFTSVTCCIHIMCRGLIIFVSAKLHFNSLSFPFNLYPLRTDVPTDVVTICVHEIEAIDTSMVNET